MENTFENALDYINNLKEINPTALSDVLYRCGNIVVGETQYIS